MTVRECVFPECGKTSHARGLCRGHDAQRRRGADLAPLRATAPRGASVAERIALHSSRVGECLVWDTIDARSGYAKVSIGGVMVFAHVAAYVEAYGPVPAGKIVDHRCRNRACVEPSHLQAVTRKQNNENRSSRGTGASGVRGVVWHEPSGLWQVQVTHHRKKHSGGYFSAIAPAEKAARDLRNALFSNNIEDRAAVEER